MIAQSDGAGSTTSGKAGWSATMSLDGFIAGPGDAMDWVFAHAGPNPVVEELIAAETGLVRSMTIPSQTNQMMRPSALTANRPAEAVKTERMPAKPITTPR